MITDYQYDNVDAERKIVEDAGFELFDYQVKTPGALIPLVRDADAIITQYSDVNREVIESLEHCKMIIKYGIGVNNIDCKAAGERGIYVCNVPDYGVQEVSDQAVTMILCLGKKLEVLQEDLRQGKWGYGGIIPVSYTHLDVYKRQSSTRSGFTVASVTSGSAEATLFASG